MIGFILKIAIDLKNGKSIIFEGSGAQEAGRVNYFDGWPRVIVSPKQLADAKSVDEMIKKLEDGIFDVADKDAKIFKESKPVQSDVYEESFDAYEFIQLIKKNINDMNDIIGIKLVAKEYNDFCFFRSYTYERQTGIYSGIMLGVTDSQCDNMDDEKEYESIFDEYAGYTPTILFFDDLSECTIVQKERFYRDADDEEIYAFEGCVLEDALLENVETSSKSIVDFLGTFKFGHYPANESGESDDIEWVILDKNDNCVLAISKYILDYIPMHKKSGKATWETSTIRKWLNEDFLNTAFSVDESELIFNTTLKANRSLSGILCNVCNDTEDKVFLLSKKDCYKYFTSVVSRTCFSTEYAKTQLSRMGKPNMQTENLCYNWWLRNYSSPSAEGEMIISNGELTVFGNKIRDIGGIRPAICINSDMLSNENQLQWFNDCEVRHESKCYIKNSVLTSCDEDSVDISIPEGVTAIGSCVFENCNQIVSAFLPESVTDIYKEAFYSSYIKTINIPSKVKNIGDSAFLSCVRLERIRIPSNINSIGAKAFMSSALITVDIEYGVHTIGESTFMCCSSMEKIVIPETITEIGADAFYGCSKLTIYAPAGSYAETYAKENNIPFVAE